MRSLVSATLLLLFGAMAVNAQTGIESIDPAALVPEEINIEELDVSVTGLMVGQQVPENNEELITRSFINTAEASQIRFTLYTSSSSAGVNLDVDAVSTITGSGFNRGNPTKVLIHSYMPNGRSDNLWFTSFRAALFAALTNINVIEVDWVDASTSNYYQASTNAQFVAARTATLLISLRDNMRLNTRTVHMYGHGVGAHISGVCASQVTGIGIITGFDPVGRQFLLVGNNLRLDSSDADFVEAWHTDDNGMGNSRAWGDVDIYFNGGAFQPGIDGATIISYAVQTASLFFGGDGVVGEAHFRGISYYRETISNSGNTYNCYQSDSYSDFIEGNSFSTSARLGGSISTSVRGSYFASTSGSSPYLSSTSNYYVVKVGTSTRRFGGFSSLTVVGFPSGSSTSFRLEPEGAIFGVALTSGNMRTVIILPDGSTPTDFTFRIDYSIPLEGNFVLASETFSVTGVTLTAGISTSVAPAGNCQAFDVTADNTASSFSLTSGTTCSDADSNLDAVTTILIVVAGAVATPGTIKIIIKFKKFLKTLLGLPGGKPINPLSAIKTVKVLKAGITALKLVAELSAKKLFIVGKLAASITILPIKLAVFGILTATAIPALKVTKLVLFLTGLTGLKIPTSIIVSQILSVLTTGDNDSLISTVISAITSALTGGTASSMMT